MDLGKVLTLGPVADLLDLFLMQDVTFPSAFVSDNHCFWHGKGKFLGGNRYTYILKLLKDAVDDLEVLPYEPLNTRILGDSLIVTIWENVSCQERLDFYIIDKWNSMVRDLFLQDKTDVGLVDLHRICIPHWNCSKPIGAHGTVKSSKILRFRMQRPLVISGKQVHHPIHCVSRKGFC